MARYPYLGAEARNYSQYLQLDAQYPDVDGKPGPVGPRPLFAEPGGVYEIGPAPGVPGLTVPPGDGLWGGKVTALPKESSSATPAKTQKGASA